MIWSSRGSTENNFVDCTVSVPLTKNIHSSWSVACVVSDVLGESVCAAVCSVIDARRSLSELMNRFTTSGQRTQRQLTVVVDVRMACTYTENTEAADCCCGC